VFHVGKAGRRDGAYVAKSEDANRAIHSVSLFLSAEQFRPAFDGFLVAGGWGKLNAEG
jgi:hypothetical protein